MRAKARPGSAPSRSRCATKPGGRSPPWRCRRRAPASRVTDSGRSSSRCANAPRGSAPTTCAERATSAPSVPHAPGRSAADARGRAATLVWAMQQSPARRATMEGRIHDEGVTMSSTYPTGAAEDFARWQSEIAALGTELNPDFIANTAALARRHLDPTLSDGVQASRDISYGPHERHVLDVYWSGTGTSAGTSGAPAAARPVVVFVHGGGFVAGAKSSEGSPFFGNIGGWAVRHDYEAVAINYVLAPQSQWPGGARDISRAISWIVEHIADFGGDPRQIVLVGQSAGAMHVADYLTRPEVYGAHGRALKIGRAHG